MKIKELFNFLSENHKFTEEYIYKNQGQYPVYSATLLKPYGYINNFTNKKDIIIIVNYGDAGKTRLIKGQFNLGRNITGLELKEKYASIYNLEFLNLMLSNLFLSLKSKGNMEVFSQNFIKNTDLVLDEISLYNQNKFIEKYNKIKEIKLKISKIIENINEILMQELTLNEFQNYKMQELTLLETGSTKISEKMIYENFDKNGVPIYSASTRNQGLMGKVSKKTYDNFEKQGNEDELTWTTNGYAGTVFYRDKKYLFSEKCGRIQVKERYKNIIFVKYLYFVLNQRAYQYSTLNSNNAKLEKSMMKLISVPIPIKNGNIDIEKQKEIISIYEKILKIKNDCELLLNKLEDY